MQAGFTHDLIRYNNRAWQKWSILRLRLAKVGAKHQLAMSVYQQSLWWLFVRLSCWQTGSRPTMPIGNTTIVELVRSKATNIAVDLPHVCETIAAPFFL